TAFANAIRLFDCGPLEMSWQHSSTTADFLGDFFALRAARSGLDYGEVCHSIIFLVNELLENALKFRAPGDIDIRGELDGMSFRFSVGNRVTPEAAGRFSELLREITTGDPGELLIER